MQNLVTKNILNSTNDLIYIFLIYFKNKFLYNLTALGGLSMAACNEATSIIFSQSLKSYNKQSENNKLASSQTEELLSPQEF